MPTVKDYDPEIFLTLNPGMFPYEKWLQLRHWDLYRYLFKEFQPVATSPFHVFWKKSTNEPDDAAGQLAVERDGGRWLSAPNPGPLAIYTVRMDYHVSNPMRRVPVAGGLARYHVRRDVVRPDGSETSAGYAASLPPYMEQWEFPVLLQPGERAALTPELRMNWTGAGIAVTGVSIMEASRDRDEILAVCGEF